MLHPTEVPRISFLEQTVEKEAGPWIAVSDNLKLVADQIAPWIPGGLMTLGCDGFGRSEVRSALRRFFEIDGECTTIATLYKLSLEGLLPKSVVAQAICDLGVDPEKRFGVCV